MGRVGRCRRGLRGGLGEGVFGVGVVVGVGVVGGIAGVEVPVGEVAGIAVDFERIVVLVFPRTADFDIAEVALVAVEVVVMSISSLVAPSTHVLVRQETPDFSHTVVAAADKLAAAELAVQVTVAREVQKVFQSDIQAFAVA